MDEPTDVLTSEMQAHLSEVSTQQLLDLRRFILERDKPFPLPPNEDRAVTLIAAELLARAEAPRPNPPLEVLWIGPHMRWQLVAVATIMVVLVVTGFIPGLRYIHVLLSLIVPAWLLWHWPYLWPQHCAER